MTATNHALTGALIGLSLANPIALLLAVASHFALDALPHYTDESLKLESRAFAIMLVVDAMLCFGLVIVLVLASPPGWQWGVASAFLATSPDFMWVPKYIRARAGQPEPVLKNKLMLFHHHIQWFARPIGAFVEIAWCAGAVIQLANYL